MMKPILVIGHALSGYERVEALLNACGMHKPLPSRREGFSPIEISAILRKAYLANRDTQQAPEIQQIEPGSIWHGMALDLMLGNLDQELWGWADPESIHLLEYWKSLDPKITFILVYNEPQTLLTARTDPGGDLTGAGLSEEVARWCACNNAILGFFYRNPGRCLLVHARQVGLSANYYLQQVQAQIDMPLVSPAYLLDRTEGQDDADRTLNDAGPDTDSGAAVQEPRPTPDAQPLQAWQALGLDEVEDPLNQYLAGDLLKQFPEARQVYEELQSVANLPLAQEPGARHSPLAAWKLMTDLRRQLEQQAAQSRQHLEQLQALEAHRAWLEQQSAQLEQDKQGIEAALQASRHENERLRLHYEEHARQHQDQLQDWDANRTRLERQNTLLEHNQQILEAAWQESRQELERLLLQHEAQSRQHAEQLQALEAHRIRLEWQGSRLEQDRQNLEAAWQESRQENERLIVLHEEHARQHQAQLQDGETNRIRLEQEKAHLEREIQSLQTARQESQQENGLLLLQLHQVQEELERQYLTGQQRQEERDRLQQQVAQQSAAQADAEKRLDALKQLKVQLEKELDAQAQQAADRARQMEQISQAKAAAERLAVERQRQLEQTSQAKTAAETLVAEQKQRLLEATQATDAAGNKELQEENELLLLQLHQVQEELERYYLENQQLKQKVGNGKSNVVQAPATATQTRANPPRYGAADRVRRQLSYRLGATMIAHHHSLMGWLKMPFALVKEIRVFKKEMQERHGHKLPPISSYFDAHEAERAKQHLSYRLGAALLANRHSPLGWLKMPWILAHEVKAFKQSRGIR